MIHSGIRRDQEHRYWLGESEKPGYSAIVKDMGLEATGSAFYTDDGREQGNVLHAYLLLMAQGHEIDGTPEPQIAGRVEGIKKFLSESGFKFAGGEVPQYCAQLGYACTPDLWGYIGADSWVIDAKRGAKVKTHKLQTAAQKMALASEGFQIQRRGSLYLKDGGYSLEEHTDTADEYRWRAIVAAYHAKRFYL